MRIIILRLAGGLGNQLFQYAFARSIQHKYGGKIIFELHTFKKDAQRDLSLNHFILNKDVINKKPTLFNEFVFFVIRVSARILQKLLLKILRNKTKRVKLLTSIGIFIQESVTYFDYLFPSAFPIKYIAGNWFSEKFFFPVNQIIKKELIVKAEASAKNKQISIQLKNENSVCVHIRRGDYTSIDNKIVCDFDYFERALIFIKQSLKSPTFYIFSNTSKDIQWIKENYKFSVHVNYIDLNNSDYEELRLMTSCKHFVLSNSTFSWWASYLAENTNKIIVAPKKWNNGQWNMKDIYQDTWIKLDN